METIDIVLWIAVGVAIGVFAFYITLKLAVNILMRRLVQDIQEIETALEETEKAIQARVELHNNVFFVYNNETNEFMAQGNDLTELRERIRARWSQYKVSVVAGDDHALDLLKAQVNEISSSQ
jgi:predicted RNase H-like HicB family nuclease